MRLIARRIVFGSSPASLRPLVRIIAISARVSLAASAQATLFDEWFVSKRAQLRPFAPKVSPQ
jgi:hypothetical protein